MNIVKKLFFISTVLATVGLSVAAAPKAHALDEPTRNAACIAIGAVAEDCNTTSANKPINNIIANIVNILSFVVAFVAVIMLIIAGFKYITSGGDSNSVTSAKNTLLYAIIGLIIVASSQLLVRFVLKGTTKGFETQETEEETTVPPLTPGG